MNPEMYGPIKVDRKVTAETYSSEYKKLDRHLLTFHRKQSWISGSHDIDVFGNFWSVAVLNEEPDKINIVRKGKIHSIDGPKGLFIPPHSLIEWKIFAPYFEWDAFICDARLPSSLGQEPFCFQWPKDPSIYSTTDLIDMLLDTKPIFNIGKLENISLVAKKTKDLIDEGFMEKISIAQIAHRLGYTHAAMTRAFKKSYGLTPVAYRNKKRIFDSLGLMMMYGQSVHSAAKAVGYDEVSQYNRQFRKQNRTVPSQFSRG